MKKTILSILLLFACSYYADAQLPSGQFLGADHIYCPGGAGLGFNGSETGFNPNWTYLWSTGETTQQIFFPYPNAGYYTVWCEVSLNGNSVTDTVHYTVYPLVDPPLLTSTSATGCVDTSVVSTPLTQGYVYQWFKEDPLSPGNYILLAGETGNSLSVTQSNTYRLKVTNQGGCFEYGNLQVNVFGVPKKYLHDTTICQGIGQPLFYITDNNNSGCTYQWDNSPSTTSSVPIDPNISTQQLGIVTITNPNGCTIKDSALITVNPLPHPLLSNDRQICSGNTEVVLKDSSHLYSNAWSYNSNIISTADSVVVGYIGSFIVTTTDTGTGCSITNTINVTTAPPPFINGFGWSRVGNCNENTYLFSPDFATNDISRFHWDFGDDDTSNYSSPIHRFPNGVDTFEVTLITEYYGVTYTDCNRSIERHKLVAGCNGGQGSNNPNPSTGIQNINKSISIDVYPNPVKGYISMESTAGTIESIIVIDIMGREVFVDHKPSKSYKVDTDRWDIGLYQIIANIKSEDGAVRVTKKLRKDR